MNLLDELKKLRVMSESLSIQASVDILGEISYFSAYEDMLREIDCLSSGDTLTINMNCPGGRVDIGQHILKRLRECSAHKKMVVTAPCYSMGAVISLAGDDLELEPHSFLMFHNYSSGLYGKGNEQEKQVTATGKYIRELFTAVCTPFLTKKELSRIFNGEDLYIHWDDGDLPQRIARHFKNSKRGQKK